MGDAAFLPARDGGGVMMARPHDLTVTAGGTDSVARRRYLGSSWRYEIVQADGTVVQADVPAGTPLLPVGSACSVQLVALHPLHCLS